MVKCAEMGCSAVDGSGVRLEMGFAGNYDDYNDVTEQEELIKWVESGWASSVLPWLLIQSSNTHTTCARAHTHTHTRTHARTHAHTRTHTHTHTGYSRSS